MTDNTQELDEILAKTIYDTGAKLTEVGWERWGENLEEAKQSLLDWHNKQIEKAMAKFSLKKGVKYDVKATDTVIVITPTNKLKEVK